MSENRIISLSRLGWINTLLILVAFNRPGFAQITSDFTLPTNSLVNQTGNTFVIDGGTTAGSNLFHSFTQFSVLTGNTAFFNNSSNITNIITRITGGQISNIDGLIRANGDANLILINPSGIVFGSNAQLDIGGSFMGSTANSIKFADGSIFSATNPQTPPLLTISVPLGLQFGSNPGAIHVSGTGHRLTNQGGSFSSQYQRGSDTRGLQVKQSRTLALIGGQVTLDGGVLIADAGRIEVGSVSQGEVTLNPTAFGWTLSYLDVQNYGDIHLNAASLLDASGGGGSGVQLVGRQITMDDGSLAFNTTQESLPGGKITLQASESINLSGTDSNGIPSGSRTQTVGAGKGGDLSVFTPRLRLMDGATIEAASFGSGRGGNIIVDAPDSVQVIGASPFSPLTLSGILSSNYGSGDGGDISLSTTNFQLMDGGILVNATYSTGAGGDLQVNVTDSLDVIGFNRVSPTSTRFRSVILAETSGSGTAGNLMIDTSRLRIKNGARIGASTVANGLGGNLTVNASESIEVSGFGDGGSLISSLSSSALANAPIQQILGLPLVPSGDAGTLFINTPRLIVSNQGRVGVDNQGFGKAGDMEITAGEIFLDQEGSISAATTSGEGGNLNLNVQNYILLRNNSQITAQAGGTGNGGNITIKSPFVVALKPENSDIIANAFAGIGGNINISTMGIFGIMQTTGPLNNSISEINASSQTGINGVVAINSPEIDTNSAVVKLSEQVTDRSNQIQVGCAAARGNSFTVTGRGGLPEDPTATIRGETVWTDLGDLSDSRESSNLSNSHTSPSVAPTSPLVEATGWIINEQGQVELVADLPKETLKPLECGDLSTVSSDQSSKSPVPR